MIEEGALDAAADRYRSGPWLIVHGHGLTSEDRANDIAAQCLARGVDYEISMIDEVDPNKDLLRSFHGLLISLPSVDGTQPTSSIRRVAEFVKAYRATRNDGLSLLLDGTRRWFEVGVVQLFGDDRLVDDDLQSVEHMVDHYHRLRDGDLVDPFAVYASGDRFCPPGAPPSQTPFARSVDKLRANLRSWGVRWKLTEIADARQCIDSMRAIWESPVYSDLRRPVKGAERNRLDFLLDDPTYDPPATECPHKKWMEGGQRVVTRVLRELQQRYPNIHRPAGRESANYKQRDFQTLYQTLRAAEEVLRIEDPEDS